MRAVGNKDNIFYTLNDLDPGSLALTKLVFGLSLCFVRSTVLATYGGRFFMGSTFKVVGNIDCFFMENPACAIPNLDGGHRYKGDNHETTEKKSNNPFGTRFQILY